jgi:TRAP-type uncharacterized transport system fused permease subunit
VNSPFLIATGTSLIVALFFTMITCLILGMGVPTTANYVIMATICAPMVIRTAARLGIAVPILSAHMFVFYFGIIADITPPVALAAYAGAAIAKCNPIKAGIIATKLAIAAFIVPYVFIFNPGMVLSDPSIVRIVEAIVSTFIRMFGISVGIQGYLLKKVSLPWRLLVIAGGIGLIHPHLLSDILGLLIVGSMVVVQTVQVKRDKAGVEPALEVQRK